MARPFTCDECGTTFAVHSTSQDPVTFCPFCGESMEHFEDDDYEDDEDEDGEDFDDEDDAEFDDDL